MEFVRDLVEHEDKKEATGDQVLEKVRMQDKQ